jgi:hypothetical protein
MWGCDVKIWKVKSEMRLDMFTLWPSVPFLYEPAPQLRISFPASLEDLKSSMSIIQWWNPACIFLERASLRSQDLISWSSELWKRGISPTSYVVPNKQCCHCSGKYGDEGKFPFFPRVDRKWPATWWSRWNINRYGHQGVQTFFHNWTSSVPAVGSLSGASRVDMIENRESNIIPPIHHTQPWSTDHELKLPFPRVQSTTAWRKNDENQSW